LSSPVGTSSQMHSRPALMLIWVAIRPEHCVSLASRQHEALACSREASERREGEGQTHTSHREEERAAVQRALDRRHAQVLDDGPRGVESVRVVRLAGCELAAPERGRKSGCRRGRRRTRSAVSRARRRRERGRTDAENEREEANKRHGGRSNEREGERASARARESAATRTRSWTSGRPLDGQGRAAARLALPG